MSQKEVDSIKGLRRVSAVKDMFEINPEYSLPKENTQKNITIGSFTPTSRESSVSTISDSGKDNDYGCTPNSQEKAEDRSGVAGCDASVACDPDLTGSPWTINFDRSRSNTDTVTQDICHGTAIERDDTSSGMLIYQREQQQIDLTNVSSNVPTEDIPTEYIPTEDIPAEDSQLTVRKIGAAWELRATEENYVNKLELLVEIYTALRDITSKDQALNEEVSIIFRGVPTLLKLHKELLKRLIECGDDLESRVVSIMKEYCHFFKIYQEPLRYHEQNMVRFEQLQYVSLPCREYVANFENSERCGRLKVKYFMLEPFQRLTRYPLLLTEFMKKLPEGSKEQTECQEVLRVLQETTKFINLLKSKLEKETILYMRTRSLENGDSLLGPGRELLKEGPVSVMADVAVHDFSKRLHLDRYLFLFNDMLVICGHNSIKFTMSMSHMEYKYQILFKLDPAFFWLIGSHEDDHTVLLKSKYHEIELYFGSYNGVKTKSEWMTAIQKVTEERCKVVAYSIQKEDFNLGNVEPGWVDDQHTMACMMCTVEFSFSLRRHHCRACGSVICEDCSSKTLKLAFKPNEESRVCEACYSFIVKMRNKTVFEESLRIEDKDDKKIEKRSNQLTGESISPEGSSITPPTVFTYENVLD